MQYPRRWWAMAAIALGVSLVIMDATIVNVALPVVIKDLGLNATEAQWMNAVYALVFAALMLTSGRLADLYGRKLLFVCGMVTFGVGSLLAGSALGPIMLILARLVQGVGAAAILPSTLSTINAMFSGRERGIAFALYGSTIGGMAAVGPLVGGWLATDVSWRWAFWLNLPLLVVALALTLTSLPETRDPNVRRGLDLIGTMLASVSLAGIVFALIESSTYGWWRQDSGALSPIPFVLVGGVVVLAAFVVWERRREAAGKVVLTHLGLFGIRSFRYGALAALIVALGEFGMLFALPLVLQGAMGYDALGTGWLILTLALGTFFASGLVPRLTQLWGQTNVVRVGLGLEAVAIGGLALALPGAAWRLGALLFAYGVGVGLATAQLTAVILSEVPVARSGEASGLQTTIRQLGSALGVALLGGMLITSLTSGTREALADSTLPGPAREQVVQVVRQSVGAAIPGLKANPATAPAAGQAAEALVHAAKITTGTASGALFVGLLATLLLRQRRADEDEPVAVKPAVS